MDVNHSHRILIADSHPIVKSGLENFLRGNSCISIAGYARESSELFRLLETGNFDVLITEYILPNGNFQDGEKMLMRVRRMYPSIKIIVITALSDPAIIRMMLDMKLDGLLMKDSDGEEILFSVKEVIFGRKYFGKNLNRFLENGRNIKASGIKLLSPRESEVLRMFLSGMGVKDIANKTHRSVKTVSNQKQSAFRKLGCRTNAEMFRLKFMANYRKYEKSPVNDVRLRKDVTNSTLLH